MDLEVQIKVTKPLWERIYNLEYILEMQTNTCHLNMSICLNVLKYYIQPIDWGSSVPLTWIEFYRKIVNPFQLAVSLLGPH
jgi:aromatic ring-opening dioxygenase LigB subunit